MPSAQALQLTHDCCRAQPDDEPLPPVHCRRMGNEEAVRALLQLGADPEAGSHGETAMSAALAYAQQTERSARGDVLALLVQAGADCLRPAAPGSPDSLLLRAFWRIAALVLPALEQRRAAGGLQLSSKHRAEQLLLVATQHGHVQLSRHAIQALDQLLVEEGAGDDDAVALATALRHTVDASYIEVPASNRLALLQSLLSSSLPLDLAAFESSSHDLIATAARQPWGMARIPLLHAAGAPLSLAALLQAVNGLDVECAAALLTYGRPPVDTSQPTVRVRYGSHSWQQTLMWSDPIHSVLQRAAVSGMAGGYGVLGGPAARLPVHLWRLRERTHCIVQCEAGSMSQLPPDILECMPCPMRRRTLRIMAMTAPPSAGGRCAFLSCFWPLAMRLPSITACPSPPFCAAARLHLGRKLPLRQPLR